MVGKRGKGEGITWKKRDGLERAGGEKSEGIIVGNRGKGKREGIRLEGWGKEPFTLPSFPNHYPLTLSPKLIPSPLFPPLTLPSFSLSKPGFSHP
jgi:hypothetical protein